MTLLGIAIGYERESTRILKIVPANSKKVRRKSQIETSFAVWETYLSIVKKMSTNVNTFSTLRCSTFSTFGPNKLVSLLLTQVAWLEWILKQCKTFFFFSQIKQKAGKEVVSYIVEKQVLLLTEKKVVFRYLCFFCWNLNETKQSFGLPHNKENKTKSCCFWFLWISFDFYSFVRDFRKTKRMLF